MVPRHLLQAFTGVSFACLLAFLLQIFFYSPISPDPLELPSTSLSTNNLLQGVVKIGEGILEGPEDLCFDNMGTMYTATRDGWIRKLHKNGSWEDWKKINGQDLLGITISSHGNLLVCDADKGLLEVGEEGVTVLASEVGGTKIRLADDVIEAGDGSVYFSDASTKFGLENWFLDVLEAKPHGRLLKYHPSIRYTSILLDGLCFANGVALSRDQDFLLVCETWKFRCLRHWLKGEMAGKTDVFVDNLPGGPDNINLAPDGSFWIALIQLRSRGLDLVHRSKAAKLVIANFPKLIEKISSMSKKSATVINIGADGKIIRSFDDSNGKVMPFITSAVEFDGHLYLGSLESNFIGKLQLNR